MTSGEKMENYLDKLIFEKSRHGRRAFAQAPAADDGIPSVDEQPPFQPAPPPEAGERTSPPDLIDPPPPEAPPQPTPLFDPA